MNTCLFGVVTGSPPFGERMPATVVPELLNCHLQVSRGARQQ